MGFFVITTVFPLELLLGDESIYLGCNASDSGGSLNLLEIISPSPSALIPAKTTNVIITALQNSFFSSESST